MTSPSKTEDKAAHSRLSASASHRWIACPGSVRLSEGIASTTSKYAAEGTAAHKLGENCISLGARAFDFIGQEVEGFTVTEEMAEAVQVYVDFVNAIAPEISLEKKEVLLKLEAGFEMPQYHKDLAGTSDCVAYYPQNKTLVVADYKHGAGVPVAVDHNPQLMIYALGGMSSKFVGDVEKVRIVVVQPRVRNGDPVKEWWISAEELAEWGATTLKNAAAATDRKDAPLYAGEHCRFCPALPTCPKHLEHACEVARVEFGSTPTLPKPETLTPEQIAKVIQFSELLSTWADSVAGYAKDVLEKGGSIPGFKLVQKKANRKWVAGAEAAVAMELGDDAYSKKLLSPAQAEEKAKALGIKLPEGLWEKPDAGFAIAPDSDKRAGVKSAIVTEFAGSIDLFQ